MACPSCGGDQLPFRVPDTLVDLAPDATLQICSTCLTLSPADSSPESSAFSEIATAFPDDTAGAAMALAVGLLVESLTLNREAILTAFDRVQAEGYDPWLILERLATTPLVDPDIDLARARHQLDQLA